MHHDFIGALEDLVYTEVPQEPLNRVLLEVAIPTMHLEGVIYNIETFICCYFLGHRAIHCVIGLFLG